MANKEWRPVDWINPYARQVRGKNFIMSDQKAYEVGASAMLKAVIEWLYEFCTDHAADGYSGGNNRLRLECPKCMEEPKGEK